MSYSQQQQYGGGGNRYEQQPSSQQQQYSGYGQSSYGQQQGGGGYGEFGGNPYAAGQQQQQQPPQQQQYGGQQQGYGQQQQQQHRPVAQEQTSSNYGQQNVSQQQSYEMTNMQQSNSRDPNFILNECRDIDTAVAQLDQELEQLHGRRTQMLNVAQPDARETAQIDDQTQRIMLQYRQLVDRTRRLKGTRGTDDPRNKPQVGRIDRRVKTALNHAQQLDRAYRDETKQVFERQYRVVRPDASAAEVQEALETDTNAFQQALVNSTRRGQAQTTLSTVRVRHDAIQKIEKDMMELAQLFQDLEVLVVQQEPAVAQIEQKGEEVNDHVQKANVELDGAVKKAAAARRKKWICLGIAVLIVIIIVVVVVVVVEVVKK